MIKQVLLFAIIYFSSYSLFSQQSYNLLNYSKVDGLSDNYIYDLEEDFRGQIWIASGHGINSFNGSNFKTYLRDDTTYSNLVRNDFLCVYEDGNNQLWFGSYNGTIYRFNHELHKFEDVSLHHVTLLEYPIFRAFYQSDSSELYGLSAHGVYRYSIYSHKFHKGFREFPVLNNEQVYAMHIDTQGNYWIGTNTKGLLCFSADSSRKIIVEFPAFSLQKPPVVRKILSLSDSLMLLGTSHGLFSVSYSDFGKFSVTQLYKDDLDGVSIDALAQDKEGNVWIGTTYKGLWIMTHKNHLRRISDIETDGVSIAIVNDIICDRDGRVWIASHGNGLFMYNPDFSGINQTGTKSGLSHNVVSAIQSDSHGNLWVGTDGGGITIFDDDMNLRKVLNQESGLSSNSIMSFELDDEYMWVSAWSGGIMRIHTKNYEIERFVTYNSNLSTNAVKSICLVDNEIYLGTHEHGLGLYNKETDSITMNLPIDYGEYYPNVQKYINKIIYDSYGKIWVATIRNLYCIENGKAINVIEKDSHIYSHNPIEVCDIVETHDNKILVATNKGPFVVDAQTFEKRSFDTLIPELAQTNILSVLSTQDSTYWLASVRGLFQYNPYTQSYKKVIFSKTSLGLFFFERAAFVDSTGTIYFGTNEGLFTFKPSEISQKHAISELYFSDLYISYEKQIPGSSTLPKHLSYVDTLVLDAYNTTWGVAFESVCYNSPEAIEYAYRLIGFDDNWNYLGKKHEVVFTNLPPGTYELQVKAWQLNIDDALSTSLFIEILPPWWKTWWFTVFALLGLALLLYVLYYMRLVSLEKQKRKLKKEVAQQTKKLENQKQHIENQHKELLHVSNKLQESNEVLSIQKEELEDLTKQLQEESSELAELNKSLKQLNETNNQFFSLITHDVKNSFYSIHSLSETLKNDYDAITTAQKHKITSLISNATLKTVDLLENLLYWSKMQSTTIECCPEYCTINEIVHYVLESYQHLAQEKNITIHFDATYDYKFYADREMIVITIRNIYNNALKYTPEGGSIEILVREIEDDIEIQIKDTGIGIEDDVLEKLMADQSKIVRNNKKEFHTSGLGLLVGKQFVEKNKGRIEIETAKNMGSVFYVFIPQKPHNIVLESFNGIYGKQQFPVKQHAYCIAIIEDNPAILRLFRDFLEQDFMCVLFSSPLDFLEAIKHETFDMIISDIMMPQMDGITLCTHIKNNPKSSRIPCVLISSQHDDEVKRQVYENGADAFLQKPVSKPVLLALVNKLFLQSENNKKDSFTIDVNRNQDKDRNQFSMKFDEIVKQNISNSDFSVEDMAQSIGMSRTQLFRKVKQLYAMSPKDYLIKVRMHAAAELLQYNDSRITEIAYASGFSDPSYFTRCFVKHYGVTPSDYRDSLLRL